MFLGLVTVIPTSYDLLGEALEVVRALAFQGVLHGILRSELLQCEVEEMVDAVEDLECHQGLHCIQVELREADIQVQQSLPKERVKRQPKSFKKVVLYTATWLGGRSRLVRWPREPKLHKIRDLIEFPDKVHLSGCLRWMPIHLKLREWLGNILSRLDWVPTLFSGMPTSSTTPISVNLGSVIPALLSRSTSSCRCITRL